MAAEASAFGASAPSAALASARAASPVMVGEQAGVPAEARALAKELNPLLGYYDPLGLASADFWSKGNDFTWGFLRQAEIKHGRVAMFGFVGYIVQANHIHWPFPMKGGGVEQVWYDPSLSPPEQWDALPLASRMQIVLFVGFLEWWSEFAGETHYCKGGKPGAFPAFGDVLKGSPHPFPLPPLFQPLGGNSKYDKEKGLLAEINNGRLAMIGLFGFLSEQSTPGSVPFLTGIVKPYAGDVMAPFM